LGLLALALAVIGVVMFGTAVSITGPFPKSVVYGHDAFYAVYSASPVISVASAAAAVVIAIIVLRSSPRALRIALAACFFGLVIFFVVTSYAAGVMRPINPTPLGKGGAAIGFPVVVMSPLLAGLAGLEIGVILLLALLRGVSGRRMAMAALINGGVVTIYWLLNFLVLGLGGGD
jgi:hypothetical protein